MTKISAFERLKPLAKSTQGREVFENVPCESLIPDPEQPRKNFSQIDSLAESIRQHGIIEPLVVRKKNNGQYIIIAGERRYRAAMQAGVSSLPCYIKPDIQEGSLFVVQMLENLQREDLTLMETARSIAELRKTHKVNDICRLLSKSKSWVSQFSSLSKACPSVVQLIDDDRLNDIGAAVMLDQLYGLDKSVADDLSKNIEHVSRHQLRSSINEIKAEAAGTGIVLRQKFPVDLEKALQSTVKRDNKSKSYKILFDYNGAELELDLCSLGDDLGSILPFIDKRNGSKIKMSIKENEFILKDVTLS